MFDLNEAQNIAAKRVKKIIESDPELSESEVEEVRLERETELAWIFVAEIPKLIKEGWIPGAITLLIDKEDGHVLTEEEQIHFHKNLENERRRAGFIRQR
jgi:hypothetical protein